MICLLTAQYFDAVFSKISFVQPPTFEGFTDFSQIMSFQTDSKTLLSSSIVITNVLGKMNLINPKLTHVVYTGQSTEVHFMVIFNFTDMLAVQSSHEDAGCCHAIVPP